MVELLIFTGQSTQRFLGSNVYILHWHFNQYFSPSNIYTPQILLCSFDFRKGPLLTFIMTAKKEKDLSKQVFDSKRSNKLSPINLEILALNRDEGFLHAAFRGYDKNKDGKISIEEFKRVMTRRWVLDRLSFQDDIALVG